MSGNAFSWTPELEEEILGRMMAGEGIAAILGDDRDSWLPSERTFYRRLADDAEFCQRYVRAREVLGHREADEVRAIADAATPEDVNVARLRVEARKWRASKLTPKVYGDKTAVEHSNDPDNPLPSVVTVRIVKPDNG
jgi:hypothetical protein